MMAQDESVGNTPCGATRTRMVVSLNAVIRIFARPAVSSTPSRILSTCWTAPICCQPCASAGKLESENQNKIRAQRFVRANMDSPKQTDGQRILAEQLAEAVGQSNDSR